MKRKAAVIAALCMCAMALAACKINIKSSSASGDNSSSVIEGSIKPESKKEYSVGELYKVQDILLKHYKELHLLEVNVSESKGKIMVKVETDFAQNFYGLTDGLGIDREMLEVTTGSAKDIVPV